MMLMKHALDCENHTSLLKKLYRQGRKGHANVKDLRQQRTQWVNCDNGNLKTDKVLILLV